MCGRVFQSYNINQLLKLAGTKLIKNPDSYESSYNVGPTNYLPAICRREHSTEDNDDNKDNTRVLEILKWGYESPFQIFIINARAEELQLKRTFQPLMDTRRCVVIVEGYFQWNARKEPYVFRPKQKQEKNETQASEGDVRENCLYLAALKAEDDSVIILTRESMGTYHDIHPRTPVILTEEEIDTWLDYKNKFDDIQPEILDEKSEKWKWVTFYQVAPYVGNVREKSEKVLTKQGDFVEQLDDEGILKYFSPNRNNESEEDREKEKDTNEGTKNKEDSDDIDHDKIGILKYFSPTAEDKLEEEREKRFKEDEKGKDENDKGELHQSEIQEFFPIVDKAEGEPEEEKKKQKQKEDKGETSTSTKRLKEESEKKNVRENPKNKKEIKMKEQDQNIIIEEVASPKEGEKISDMVPEIQKVLDEVGVEPGRKFKVRRAVVITLEDEKVKNKSESSEGKENLGTGLKKRKDYDNKEEEGENLHKKKQVKKNVN